MKQFKSYTPKHKILYTEAGYRTYQYKDVRISNNHDVKQRESLGYRLGVWLDHAHMTPKELCMIANAIGEMNGTRLTTSDLGHYLKGRCCPKAEKLLLISKATGMSINWLQGYGDMKYGLEQRDIEFRADHDRAARAPRDPKLLGPTLRKPRGPRKPRPGATM